MHFNRRSSADHALAWSSARVWIAPRGASARPSLRLLHTCTPCSTQMDRCGLDPVSSGASQRTLQQSLTNTQNRLQNSCPARAQIPPYWRSSAWAVVSQKGLQGYQSRPGERVHAEPCVELCRYIAGYRYQGIDHAPQQPHHTSSSKILFKTSALAFVPSSAEFVSTSTCALSLPIAELPSLLSPTSSLAPSVPPFPTLGNWNCACSIIRSRLAWLTRSAAPLPPPPPPPASLASTPVFAGGLVPNLLHNNRVG